ncbi:MAG: GxxExxY protein [Saprospiraceae bacterium]|nr:GxxExxY protein [Saprospiraceae bacterium]
MTKKLVNQISYEVVGCAIAVHKELGPGMLESIYEDCMCIEFEEKGIKFQRQVPIELNYKGRKINRQLKLDLLVENTVIVELKAVEMMNPIYTAQLLSYLNQAKLPKGLLINFNETNIVNTMIPLVSKYFKNLPDQ